MMLLIASVPRLISSCSSLLLGETRWMLIILLCSMFMYRFSVPFLIASHLKSNFVMNKNRYGELLSLANALGYICDSDLLWSLMKDAGYEPNTFDLHLLVEQVAKQIYLELTA